MKILELEQTQVELAQHPLFSELTSVENIRIFMQNHVFAVWDFMSLLKSLQQKLTCVGVPWKPSHYPANIGRLINEIVLGEETDLSPSGDAMSHFEMYLLAMKEIGASTSLIDDFLHGVDYQLLPKQLQRFVTYHIDLAVDGDVIAIMAAFFYGREKVIPSMFSSMREVLLQSKIHCPQLLYYLDRHIELDGEEHGPMAMQALELLTADDRDKELLAFENAKEALRHRRELWDYTLEEIKKGKVDEAKKNS